MKFKNRFLTPWWLFIAGLAVALTTTTAETPGDSGAKQRELIALLQSDAAPPEKAIACKQLAVYGNSDAVPVLAPLLADEHLSSWARIPLEVIPGPAADEALRQALAQLQGHLLVGVINSIGIRRDPQAVEGLVARLPDADVEVAVAAAVALGRIGNEPATQALTQSLTVARMPVRSAVAQGLILCAEKMVARGSAADAVALFDTLRQTDLPQERKLEATRGVILARQSAGIPLLLDQLRSPNKAFFGIGLRTARELPGREVTEALAAEIGRAAPDRQPLILLALADRQDPAVLPAVLAAAASPEKPLRLSAVKVLEHIGNATCVPVLLEAAVANDAEVAKAARSTLERLQGNEVDAAILSRLSQAKGASRIVLIKLCGQRHLMSALPTITEGMTDPDAGVRRASLEAMSTMGGLDQLAGLVKMFAKAEAAEQRAELEGALLEVSARAGADGVPQLLTLARNPASGLRLIGIHALASVGGPEALAAVRVTIDDPEEKVQDEAVRTLSTWPNNWPDDVGVAEPLLALAKSGRKRTHEVLGFRGYVQYLQADKRLKDADRVARVKEVLPLIKWPEEKQSAIAVLGTSPTADALEMLVVFAGDPATAEEAYSAMATLAAKDIPGVSKEQRQETLRTVAEKSKNDSTRKRAEQAAKAIK